MSIFSKIKDAIFGKKAEAATPAPATPAAPADAPRARGTRLQPHLTCHTLTHCGGGGL